MNRAACKRMARKEPPVTAAAPQEYATTDELAAALSFPLALPQTLPDGYAFDSASDQFGMAVVVYADAEGHTLKYCMGKGETRSEGMNHAVSGETEVRMHCSMRDRLYRGRVER